MKKVSLYLLYFFVNVIYEIGLSDYSAKDLYELNEILDNTIE